MDIAIPSEQVVIEVDGPYHYGVAKVADEKRQEFLEGRGWKVIRVTHKDLEPTVTLPPNTKAKLIRRMRSTR